MFIATDLAEQLEEGGGEGQVHQPAVLQGLGQEHAQAPEQVGHPPTQRGVLGQRGGEQAMLPARESERCLVLHFLITRRDTGHTAGSPGPSGQGTGHAFHKKERCLVLTFLIT